MQVRQLYKSATVHLLTRRSTAVAGLHEFLLFRNALARLCVPHVLFVSLLVTFAVTDTNDHRSMRYSRMLEESSFANRKADYVWLLILSSAMLLVSFSCRFMC